MKTILAISAAGLIVFGTMGMAQAVMISPQSVVYNSMGEYNADYSPQKMIDHSGLITDFTSGVTELSAYLENTYTGAVSDSYSNAVGSFASNGTTNGYIDFDLGGEYELTTFLLWNDSDYQGINNFQLLVDDDPSFSNPKLLGNFSASYSSGWNIPLQQFTFNKATGRYVRLEIFDIHQVTYAYLGQLAQVAEIAFDATPAVADSDGDGILDANDNCPNVYNPDQANFDDDALGNACDPDDDNDGIPDAQDNCQYDYNPQQYDTDKDGIGDACDTDIDGDNVVDAVDACLDTKLGEAVNQNGCSIEQMCPCDNPWANHGDYVKCVSLKSDDFVANGCITVSEKGYMISDAAASDCGQKDHDNRKNK